MKTHIITVIAIIICSFKVGAQHAISGIITDSENIGLMAATCFLKNDRKKVAISGINGEWSLQLADSNLADTLEVRYLGYQNSLIPVSEFTKGESKTIILNTNGNIMSEIFITASNPISEDFSVEKLERLDIYFNPLAKGDPLNAIQMLPASTDTEESASPSLRGSSPTRTIVVVDGVPLRSPVKFTQLNGTGNFSIFTTEIIESQNVYAGNPPLIYGNTSAGLVDIRLRKKTDQEGWALGASLGHVSTMWSKNIEDDKGYVSFFANANHSALFKAANGKSLNNINQFRSIDNGMRLFYNLSENLSLSLYNYTAIEDYDTNFGLLSFRGNAIGSQKRNFSVAAMEWSRGRHQWRINTGANFSESAFSYGNIRSDTKRKDLYSSINYKYITEQFIIQTGLSYGYNKDSFEEKHPTVFYNYEEGAPTFMSTDMLSQDDFQSYTYAKYYLGNFTLSGAIRANIPKSNQDQFISRQLSAKYQPHISHSLLFSAGKYHNYNYPTSENKLLLLMQSNQVALEYQYDTENLDISLAIYDKSEDNLLDRFTSNFGVSNGNRKIRGVEMAFSKQLGKKWTLDVANTFLDVKVVSDEFTYRGDNDFNYFLKLGLTLFNNDVFNAGLSYITRPGRHFTGINGGFPDLSGGHQPIFSREINSSQYESYHNVSLTFNRQFTVMGDKSMVIYGVLNNLLDTNNQNNAIYNFDYSQQSFNYYGKRWFMVGAMVFI